MTEFYKNLNKTEIKNIIKQKLRIYEDQMPHIKYNDVPIKATDFQFKNYIRYNKLDPSTCQMFKYGACHLGVPLYEFYNVIITPKHSQQKEYINHNNENKEKFKKNPHFEDLKKFYEAGGISSSLECLFDKDDGYFERILGTEKIEKLDEDEKEKISEFFLKVCNHAMESVFSDKQEDCNKPSTEKKDDSDSLVVNKSERKRKRSKNK